MSVQLLQCAECAEPRLARPLHQAAVTLVAVVLTWPCRPPPSARRGGRVSGRATCWSPCPRDRSRIRGPAAGRARPGPATATPGRGQSRATGLGSGSQPSSEALGAGALRALRRLSTAMERPARPHQPNSHRIFMILGRHPRSCLRRTDPPRHTPFRPLHVTSPICAYHL